ncbi:hypothetical protein FEM48_Zijuj03G0118800 [Ziziphus jujuba var. spinosa]|uniref:Uncharacterized protein n=1 Tax=Ziziphus jujuba var. spinosa TaxID=714518 RepID=A0A978VQ57_ZIZJJ|nr:hypothetical protein FEM48_Zijuj03G0118800 [Ziziphus jujuba var. spinosa]
MMMMEEEEEECRRRRIRTHRPEMFRRGWSAWRCFEEDGSARTERSRDSQRCFKECLLGQKRNRGGHSAKTADEIVGPIQVRSKTWRSLISDPTFIRTHLSRMKECHISLGTASRMVLSGFASQEEW